MSDLSDRLIAIHYALRDAGIEHAFGGAIALAYCTEDPRGTHDLDVNVFVKPEDADVVLDALPSDVKVSRAHRVTAKRDGQARVRWNDTPIDLFFAAHEFYGSVAEGVRVVPFDGVTIPVIGCVDLIVFKMLYGRTQDWADIENMLQSGVDGELATERAIALLGPDDPSVARLARTIAG